MTYIKISSYSYEKTQLVGIYLYLLLTKYIDTHAFSDVEINLKPYT